MGSAHPKRPWRLAAATTALILAFAQLGGAPSASADGVVTFRGGGYGHGVGMSQHGACGMAAQGHSASAILKHYYQGSAVTTTSEPGGLRVLIGTGSSFSLVTGGRTTFNGVGILNSGATVKVTRSGNRVVLSGALNGSVSGALRVRMAGTPLRVSPPSQRFDRGELVIKTDSGSGLLAIVDSLSTRDYLLGLGEVPSSWPAEALKAQAIAGRTIAKQHAGAGGDYDLRAAVDGAYIGYEKLAGSGSYASAWVSAVDGSAGRVVTHNGSIISAVYSSSSGGYTENSENVWSSPLPYLRAVPDPADSGCNNPNFTWTKTFAASELGTKLGMGPITAVSIAGSRGASGRLDKASITFTDSGGAQKSFTGAQMRSWLGLRSTKFTIDGASDNTGSGAPSGSLFDIRVHEGRKLLLAGTAADPDGAPRVFIADLNNGRITWRVAQSVNGYFLDVFDAAPGKHTTCAAVLDTPSNTAVMLGCRDNVVK